MPSKIKPSPTRERRIPYDIVVDAYTSEERALSWYYYLESQLAVPFKAKCIAKRSISPLKKGEEVEVLSMAKELDCTADMLVLIRFGGRKLGIPLAQLAVVNAGRGIRQAMADWHYWLAMGYEL